MQIPQFLGFLLLFIIISNKKLNHVAGKTLIFRQNESTSEKKTNHHRMQCDG